MPEYLVSSEAAKLANTVSSQPENANTAIIIQNTQQREELKQALTEPCIRKRIRTSPGRTTVRLAGMAQPKGDEHTEHKEHRTEQFLQQRFDLFTDPKGRFRLVLGKERLQGTDVRKDDAQWSTHKSPQRTTEAARRNIETNIRVIQIFFERHPRWFWPIPVKIESLNGMSHRAIRALETLARTTRVELTFPSNAVHQEYAYASYKAHNEDYSKLSSYCKQFFSLDTICDLNKKETMSGDELEDPALEGFEHDVLGSVDSSRIDPNLSVESLSERVANTHTPNSQLDESRDFLEIVDGRMLESNPFTGDTSIINR